MTKKIIFQDSFLVTGIMCHEGCGTTIQNFLSNLLDDYKQQHLLPKDAQLIIDAEPQALGIHRLFIMVESEEDQNGGNNLISDKFKENLNAIGFDVIDNDASIQNDKSNKVNWINILVNLISMSAIISLSTVFPPSLLLTIGLTTFSFLATTFTARSYLINFFRNLRNKDLANMTTTITLGWLFSFAHTLYHSITMPLASSFSMTFMSFIMPVMLITIINSMDEIKRLVLDKSKKMHLHGMKTLFPQMAKEYPCYQLSQLTQEKLSQLMKMLPQADNTPSNEFLQSLQQILLDSGTTVMQQKNSLTQGMIIKIKRGECFPVDGILIQGKTLVDASLLTGEPQQGKQCLDFVHAGAVNLGQDVIIYAQKDSYNSTVNQILFRSNRAQEKIASKPNHKFTYLYTTLIFVGVAASILTPFTLGIFSIPLLLQNVTGILFAVCPCTIAIAHQLPSLLRIYQLSNKGFMLRNERLIGQSDEIHTIVFDKTGTLTTGNSKVDYCEGISDGLWQRIHLLEKHHGAGHPLAKAITEYYEASYTQQSIFNDIREVLADPENRGLSATVQGKPIYIGNSDYLRKSGIELPKEFSRSVKNKLAQGYSPVYVAEDNSYQGVILIKHEVRKDILPALARLKKEGKKLIMLTGDSYISATGFNQQNGAIFDLDNIHAEQTPQDKENFLREELKNGCGLIEMSTDPSQIPFESINALLNRTNAVILFTDNLYYADIKNQTVKKVDLANKRDDFNSLKENITDSYKLADEKALELITSVTGRTHINSKGVWFVGDGLNDAPCARIVTEKGGVSCAMTSDDKAAFFTDISLNGTLDYLFEHNRLNQFLKKNILQNQWLVTHGSMAFLAFIITFSIAGIAVSPLIPLIIMVSTTLFTLFNSYRVKLAIDNALDKNTSWLKQLLASDLSIGLPVSASTLLICSILISTLANGGLTFPAIVFTAGTVAAISSASVLAASAMFGLFVLLGITYLFVDTFVKHNTEENPQSTDSYSNFHGLKDVKKSKSTCSYSVQLEFAPTNNLFQSPEFEQKTELFQEVRSFVY